MTLIVRDIFSFRIPNIVLTYKSALLHILVYYIRLLRYSINFTLFSLTLYVDKRRERVFGFLLPQETDEYELTIGMAPFNFGHEMGNFVGSIKKLVYYPSTKYEDEFRGDGECYYKI